MRERLVNEPHQVEELFRVLEDANEIVIDTETSGLDWKRNHVVGHVLTPRSGPSYYVPVRHLGGGNLPGCRVPATADGWRGDIHPFEIKLAHLAKSRPRRWAGHNLLFDLRFLHPLGIDLYGDLEDTGINAPLIDENQYSYSLENVAKYMGVQEKKGDDLYQYLASVFGGEPNKKQMAHFWKTDASVPVVWQYAAGDGVSTEEVLIAQQKYLDEEDLRTVWGVECRLIRTLFRMTTGGVRINENRLHQVDEEFERMNRELAGKFPPGFNSKSSTSMKAFLADYIDDNWPRNPPTETELKKARSEGRAPLGALKFDADTISRVPPGRDIVAFRQVSNARSLYTQPMINRHLWKGHVHCEFWQMASDDYGTISGRLSSAEPNLQAVTKRNKLIGKLYRSVFEPDEDQVWDDNDYKQQEYVVFTDYTGDPNLLAGYAQDPPVDIHQTVADMLGIERDPGAKRMNLGMLYGMGIVKLAFSLGVSVDQAKRWMDDYHRKFPYAKRFLKQAEQRAKARGYVYTFLGRRRRFTASLAHKAGNGVIQGSSADITKLKMVEIDEYFASEGDDARLLLQIHDSLSWSRPKGERGEKLRREALAIMENFEEGQPIHLRARLRVDASSGPNWSVATYG